MSKAHYFHLTFRALVMLAKLHWRLEERNSAAPVIKKECTVFLGPWSRSKLIPQELCLGQVIALIRSAKCVRDTSEPVI